MFNMMCKFCFLGNVVTVLETVECCIQLRGSYFAMPLSSVLNPLICKQGSTSHRCKDSY